MNNHDFENICDSLPNSIKMKLNHIKRFLDDGRASVMVGAGFSKNAIMGQSTNMLDWNSLGKVFFKRLYSRDPESKDLEFTTPMRLASQIESCFGRNALDELIISSLPDLLARPSDLHISLLRLNWKDVFTTNYDTLLERASIDSEKHYEFVTNKETLLYRMPPRIIKLHGSFKNIRPFIITEEDYRKYPQDHPIFVNTVKQALIEGLLCLIGFSGNDPNFLSWVGWLRDVIGSQSSPVYLITYDKTLHESEILLSKSRGIDTINLSEIKNLSNIRDALHFFFEYMEIKSGKNQDWSGEFSNYLLGNKDDVASTIKKMKAIRISYPGWLLLPRKHYNDFNDIDKDFPFMGDKLQTMSIYEKLDFMFELDWRVSISLSPKNIRWYVECLEEIFKSNSILMNSSSEKFFSVILSLLSVYRHICDKINFSKIEKFLSTNISQLNKNQYNILNYEKAIQAVSSLNYSETESILHQWRVSKTDYIGILWKSVISAEIGKVDEAIVCLNASLQNLKSEILQSDNSPYLQSCKQEIEYSLYIFKGPYFSTLTNGKGKNSFEFDDISSFFIDNIKKTKSYIPVSFSHGFNINNSTTTWHGGNSGFEKHYINSYRYILLYEMAGFPIGLSNLNINSENFQTAISNIIDDNIEFAISIIIRTCNNTLVKECITRYILKGLTRNEANKLFDKLYDCYNLHYGSKNLALTKRLFAIIVPILARLTVKISADKIISTFSIIRECYLTNDFYYDENDLKTVYDCLYSEQIQDVLKSLFTMDVKLGRLERDIAFPKRGYKSFTVPDEAIKIIANGLASKDLKIQSAAYTRATYLYNSILKTNQKKKIDKLLYNWRNASEVQNDFIYSYNLLSYSPAKDKRSQKELCTQAVDRFLSGDYTLNRSSEPLQKIESNLMNILPGTKTLEDTQNEKILKTIFIFLCKNEEILKKDDSNSFFGGLRHFSNELFYAIRSYIELANLSDVNKKVLHDFYDIVLKYLKYGFPCIAILVIINSKIKASSNDEIKTYIDNFLFSNKNLLLDDAIRALIVLPDNKVATRNLLTKIVDFIELAQHESSSKFLQALVLLYAKRKINKQVLRKLPAMLTRLYDNIDSYKMPEEFKTEIYYYANKLAGAMSVISKDKTSKEAISKWESLTKDENTSNDIRLAFQDGIDLVKNFTAE